MEFSFVCLPTKTSLLVSIAVLLSLLAPVAMPASPSVIVTDYATGAVLVAEDAETSKYPASLTKLMTLYLLFEAVEEGRVTLDQKFPVSTNAAGQPPTKLRLKPGASITAADCIDALILRSANDVAVVVAEALGGSESVFAATMTRKAAQLGMTATAFRNASGLPDEEQVVTARDLAVLAHALIKRFPEYYPHFSLRTSRAAGIDLEKIVVCRDALAGADGLKTGYTRAAGYNLAASVARSGHRLIGVVLGEPNRRARDLKMIQIMNQAFLALGVPLPHGGKKLAAKSTHRRHYRKHSSQAALARRRSARSSVVN